MTPRLCSPYALPTMQEGTGLQATNPVGHMNDTLCFQLLQNLAASLCSQRRWTGWGHSPRSMSAGVHIPSPPLEPVGQSRVGVPAGPCSPALPASLRGPLLLAGCLCRSERLSLHVCGFVSIHMPLLVWSLLPHHATCFSSMPRGVSVDPVLALMSPEIPDRVASKPGWGWGTPVTSLTLDCLPAGMSTEVSALWDRAHGPEPRPRGTYSLQASDSPSFSHAGLSGKVTSIRCQGAAEQEGLKSARAWALSPLCRAR